MAVQQFCLRWNNHQPNFISVFTNLLTNETLVDVTLAAEGKQLQAHKVVLSACSTYFQALFTSNPCQHPIVILKDIKYNDLKTMVDFMYYGEVNVSQDQLPAILKTAETLKVKGLAEMPEQLSLSKSVSQSSEKAESPSPISPSVLRRKRLRKSSTGSGSEQTSEETAASGSGSTDIIPSSPVKHEPEEAVLRHEPSTESETREGSHSFEDDNFPSRTVSEETTESNIRWSSTEENRPGPSQPPPQVVEPTPTPSIGSKRGRLLMRQHRIKKESEVLHCEGESELPRMERQCSEPTPNLLAVPQQSYLTKQNSSPHLTTVTTCPSPAENPPQLRLKVEEFRRTISTPQCSNEPCEAARACHCPVLRPGPALGCNFCWNTIDKHGRILRRKTKYHCPECQTNLCIVPCFQEYHERQGSSGSVVTRDITPSDPLQSGQSLTTIMKTSSL
ncbi:protein bric-a-brac 2 isoform X1 [Halyomorpha halys]|uniref:protein bric-a-brac 2 isoform X1 n=1 Tax=Halyomorpha halys TaxID=286706 RepID=UPI0006D501B2|nr:protein bric-a-brac 2-like isoform X1 [Halyomorpha halys]XP_014290218.1 protein bric-a-brac 2-like isoform X1 [Halyomorpha halys]